MSTRFTAPSRCLAAAAGVFLLGTVSAAPAAAAGAPAAPASPGSTAAARGALAVRLDPATLRAEPLMGGARCRLRVAATLDLSGTVEGSAAGTTTADVHAPCPAVLSTPPGTFADTFRFTGRFHGAVLGAPASAAVEYTGITRAGGSVSAGLVLYGNTTVLAGVRATAGEGGNYAGLVIAPGRAG